MKFISDQGRAVLTGQVISVAGTLLLAGPAVANNGHRGGHENSMRPSRAENAGARRHELRQLIRNERIETQSERRSNAAELRILQREYLPVHGNDLRVPAIKTSLFQRSNGQSQFTNDRGATRAIARGLELDLTSDKRAIVLGDNLFADATSYTVTVGGEERILTSGSKVSAAEFVALQQVLDGGSQNLVVDQSGRGVDGQFTLNGIDDAGRNIKASSLVVPVNVEVVGNFGRSSEFKLTHDLTNYGSVYALSDRPGADKATIAARDITNNGNASISSVIPDAVAAAAGAINSPVDLEIKAERNLTNAGSISSSGTLTMSAGRQLLNSGSAAAEGHVGLQFSSIINSGSISSASGDVIISTVSPADIYVDNTGGTVSALNGAINFRDPSFTAKHDTTLQGGDWLSEELNLNSGDGHLDVHVNEVSGAVTAHTGTAAIFADSPNLYVKELVTNGDPLIFNSGTINLGNQTTSGGPLTVVSGVDVSIQSGVTLNTNSGTGDAGDILLIAGAAFTSSPGSITVTGASATGGNVTFVGTAPVITATSTAGDGGDITVAAFLVAGGTGQILLGGATTITSNGSNGNDNGNVLLLANTITVSVVDTKGAGTTATGNVTLTGRQPAISGSLVINDPNGNVISGSLVPGADVGTSSIDVQAGMDAGGSVSTSEESTANINHPIVAGGSVSIVTTQNIDIRNNVTAPGGILMVAGREIQVILFPSAFSTTAPGQAGNVTFVSGAGFTDNGATVTITGASGTNAATFIGLNFGSDFIDARGTGVNANGGNVTLVSFANSLNQSGVVDLDSTVDIRTGGTNAGTNGNVTIVAGNNDGSSGVIYRGPIDTSGGVNGTGNITLHTTTPGSGAVLSKANGGISSGSFLGGAAVNGGIFGTGGSSILQTDGGDIDLLSGRGGIQSIDTETITAQNGLVRLNAVGVNSDMRLRTIQGGGITVTATGVVDLRSSWNTDLTGGGIVIVAGRDILNVNSGDSFSTVNSSGSAGSVTLVAGATFSESAGSITITGGTATGGNLGLGNAFDFINTFGVAGGAAGGDVNLIAFADATGAGGVVSVDTTTNISTQGNAAGTNGNILFMGGHNQGGVGVATGGPLNTSGGQSGTGKIDLFTAQPGTGVTISKTTGKVTAGSFTAGAITTNAGITGANGSSTYTTDGASFNVAAGNGLDFTGTSANVGSARIAIGALIQGLSTITATGSIVVTAGGPINLRGNFTAFGGVTMVSSAEIANINNLDFISTSTNGDAGDVVLVSGATFTQNATTITITGASGNPSALINLGNGFSGIDTTSLGGNGDGGSVTLIAFDGGGGNGTVFMQSGTNILTGGTGSGTNGNLIAVSGRNSGATGIQLNANIDTSGGLAGTGDITFNIAAPNTGVQIVKADASLVGSFLGGAAANSQILMTTGSIVLDSADLVANAGTASDIFPINAGPSGNVTINTGLVSTGTATLRTITAGTLSVAALGGIDLRGGNITTAIGTLLVTSQSVGNNGGAMTITSANAGGDAGNIIIVAGAAFTQNAASITVTGASATGGNVGLGSGFAGLDARSTGGNGDGGKITLVAFADGAGNNGDVSLDSASTTNASGNGTGAHGNVLIIGSRNNGGEAINVGGPITVSGGTNGTTSIVLKTVQPSAGVNLSRSTISAPVGSFDSSIVTNTGIRAQTTITASGGGGGINILSGNNVIIDALNVSPAGAVGDGGSIIIETTGTDLNIGNPGGTNRVSSLSFNGGSTSGGAGSVHIVNNGTNQIRIHGNVLQPVVVEGNGANIDINADQGTLSFNTGSVTLSASAQGAAAHDAGTIILTANNFAFNSGNVALQASAAGGGNAGAVILNSNASIDGLLGPGPSQFSVGPIAFLRLNSLAGGVNLTAPVNVPLLSLTSTNANITQTAGSTITATNLVIELLGGAPGIADLDNFVNTIGSLSGAGGGSIFLDNGATNLQLGGGTPGGLGASQSLTASTTGSIGTNSNITTTGDITLITPNLTNNFAMSANSISVTSQPLLDLTVNGTGSFNATGIGQQVTFSTDQDMTIGGTFTFISQAEMTLNNPGNVFTVAAGANIVGQQLVTVNVIGSTTQLIGLLTGNPLVFNTGAGTGTIANSIGDVVLTGVVQIVGGDIAIIASGNITSTGSVQLLSATPGGTAGSITLLAGFNFTPPTPGQVVDSTTTFTNFAANATGGSITLTGVNIDASSGGGAGGNVLIVANGGTTNNGSIALGNIDASGTTLGGNISVFGEGNITLGNLDNSGASALNNVSIRVTAPIVLGIPQILNGTLSGGTFDSSTLGTGSVTTGTIAAGLGSVDIGTDGVTSSIAVGNSLVAGNVILDAHAGNLNLSHLAGIAVLAAPSGDGGSIQLNASTMTIAGSVTAPFALNADGAGTGSGGFIAMNDGSQTTTYVGSFSKPKPGSHFLTLSAVSGNGAGADGGQLSLLVGGNLFIDTSAFDAGPKGTGPSDGAAYGIGSGTTSSKGGTLVMVGDLSSAGINGGADRGIGITMKSSTAFDLQPTKAPKNGVSGRLSAGTTGGIDIENLNGGITVSRFDALTASTISLKAGGKGALETTNAAFVRANSLNLETNLGNIGAKSSFFVDTPDLTVSSGGAVHVDTTSGNLITLQDSFGNKGFEVCALGSITVNNLNTTAGDISILSCGATLTVNAGANVNAANGALSLINGNTIDGDIFLGTGSTVQTSAKGDVVTIAIGVVPQKPINTAAPGNIVLNPQGKGVIYFEPAAGVVALLAPSNVNAIGKRVLFSNTSTNIGAEKITLNGNVTVTADPPLREHAVSAFSALLANPSIAPLTANASEINPVLNAALDNSSSNSGNSFGAQTISLLPTDLLSTRIKNTNSDMTVASLAAIEDSAPVRTLTANSGISDAFVWCDEELGLERASMLRGGGNVNSGTADLSGVLSPKMASDAEVAKLRKGTIVLAPSKNTRLDTPIGSIEIAKGAVALVVLDDTRLAVYDLHDSRKGSIRVSAGSRTTTLSPGRCTVLTNKTQHAFERVNPLEGIGYKLLGSQHHEDGIKAFNAEFSTLSAISSIKPLRALFASRHDAAKRMSGRLMKTSAVLMQLASSEEFRFYSEPSVTALNR